MIIPNELVPENGDIEIVNFSQIKNTGVEMFSQKPTMQQVELDKKQKTRGWAIFAVVVFFELGVLGWTAVHNIPFLIHGLDPSLNWLGVGVAALGELWALALLFMVMFVAGSQKKIALIAHIIMLAILLVNSALWFAIKSNTTYLNNDIVLAYSTFFAPLLLFSVIATSGLLILHNDPLQKKRSAEHEIESAKAGVHLAFLSSIRAMIENNAMNNPDHAETASDAATSIVDGIINTLADYNPSATAMSTTHRKRIASAMKRSWKKRRNNPDDMEDDIEEDSEEE